jgi:hypothetical protein
MSLNTRPRSRAPLQVGGVSSMQTTIQSQMTSLKAQVRPARAL